MKTLDRAPATSHTESPAGTRVVRPAQSAGPSTTSTPAALPSDSTQRVSCPDCRRPARVEWRDDVNSTSGPVVHVKVRCLDRHWFLMPESWLEATTR